MTLVAFTAAGAHVMSFSAAAVAGEGAFTGAAERQVVPHPPTAASDGLPVPALVGGIVLAFAVGIAGGQVHRRRRTAHRRSVAGARPDPVLTPPARPAPEPPAADTRAEPQPIDLAAAAPVAPAPAPPEAEIPAEQPVDLTGAPRPLPAPPPPEPQAAPRPLPEPPRVVVEPPAATAPPPPQATPPPVFERPAAPAPPEPPRRDEPQPERSQEPLRLVPRTALRPVVGSPLGEAPEVPRLEQPPAETVGPAIPLESAPETVPAPASAGPAAAPARRFARAAPWPDEAGELWTCEIAWKAGYRKSSFRAMAGPPGAGKRRPIGDSASVRWSLMGEPEPPTPELAIRVRALVQALETAGWEHIGRGHVWYAQRFVWRGSGEPQPVDVESLVGSDNTP